MRVGVIGVNGIGQAHLFALHGSTLAAVCDIDEARAQKAGGDFGVPVFTNAAALFDAGVCDAVVVATPPGTHGELVRAALDAGMHVYCEKPIAPTSDEGYALAAHARDRDRVLQIGFQFRYHLGYAAMRDAVASIAPVRRVHVTATNWFRAQQYFRASAWRASWRVAGGGVLMSQAVHQVDALIATLGMPARVRGEARSAAHDAEIEDEATAELEWADGARGSLIASLNEPAGVERFEFVGERGAVVLTDGYDVRLTRHDQLSKMIDESPDEYPETAVVWHTVEVPRAKSEWFDMLRASHREFATAVAERRPAAIDGDEGTKSVELANAIYLSSLRGETVELPLAENMFPPVYEELAAGRTILGS
jgi:predicted dehydrogenase